MSNESGAVRIKWVRDENMEQFLDLYRVQWTFHERFDLSQINRPKSRRNQARFGPPVDKERVGLMHNQAKTIELHLPAILVYAERLLEPGSRSNLYIVGDGNHRDELAILSGIKVAAAYEITDAGPQTLVAITKAANMFTGIGHTPTEMYQHAVEFALLPENENLKPSEIAPRFGVNGSRLAEKVNVARARIQFSTGGETPVPAHGRLNDSVVHRLLKLRHNDIVFVAAAEGLSRFHKVDEQTAKELVDTVLAVTPRTQEPQLAAVAAFVDRLEGQFGAGGSIGHSGKSLEPHQRVLADTNRLLRSLATYVPDRKNAKDVLILQKDREEFIKSASDVRKAITRIIKELTQ